MTPSAAAQRPDIAEAVGSTHDLPFGAQLRADGSVRFRLWAPGVDGITLVLGEELPDLPLDRQGDGWFGLTVPAVPAGTPYRYRLPDGTEVPDPASRHQRGGPLGPSIVWDPQGYAWRAQGWRGRPWHEAVIYELHCGAIGRPGGFAGVIRRLDDLARLGVTAIELMPVADFVGSRGWGYDGVLPFAPASVYGTPDELKQLVDAAHERGLMVLLDVVYNHFGPAGNFLGHYAGAFFDGSRVTPWGPAIDFARPQVRAFFRHNALYWLEEFRFDGLRFDAVHAIEDAAQPDILTEIAAAARAALPDRHIHLILENDRNEARRLIGTPGPAARFEAQWNDDFHHAAHVVLTGETDGYYADYAHDPVVRLGRALAEGFVYQGDWSERRGESRGEPSAHLPPAAFVDFLQNHDQIGNRALGDRLTALAAPEAVEAMTALLLLSPHIPLLFMGEEWGSRQPFPFFCDFEGELADVVRQGRREEFAQFAGFDDAAALPDALDPDTFDSAVLAPAEDDAAAALRLELVGTLLALRHRVIVPLLADRRIGPGINRSRDRMLDVAWMLSGGGWLRIVAHLAPGPGPAWEKPAGEIVYESVAGLAGSLPGGIAGWGLVAALEQPA
ncbi:malto-oligosyltrehalose trehalohydrolase [Inquilinus ginsengisoli]|uniref:Malto-oligosyltrehalose trehalohydrolase n=1 Tax=Inquilinus ginsengisoli TaxID=363840 RepID=A0ABU1JZB2_9PROT|nr:malto-oligosyltrehalose trehalohydrolase [Inquilinus ginsengisoli]MDR6293354.1 malto-oligosyltrehalose trehalohydrolase [Inquilinus ginsengisoli]